MKKDFASSSFFSDNERYADIINGIGCDGVPFVKGKDLQELDTKTNLGRFMRRGGKGKKSLYRDLLRKTPFGINFAIIGIENQEEIDYALRLFPTVTFVLYYGEKEWDGAKDLHGLLDFTGIPGILKEKISNYRIHVVEVRKLEETAVFRTDVKQVFDFIRFSKDKRKLKELVTEDEAYGFLDEEAYDMVLAYAGEEEMFKIKEKHKKGGKVNMCQGLREWMEDERAEGRFEGEDRFAGLAENLIKVGRTDDLLRATTDKQYREILFKELRL